MSLYDVIKVKFYMVMIIKIVLKQIQKTLDIQIEKV